jgi:hypothetical protein
VVYVQCPFPPWELLNNVYAGEFLFMLWIDVCVPVVLVFLTLGAHLQSPLVIQDLATVDPDLVFYGPFSWLLDRYHFEDSYGIHSFGGADRNE